MPGLPTLDKDARNCEVLLFEKDMANTNNQNCAGRHIIKAVVTMMTVLLIVLGILGGIWLLTEHHQTTLQYTLKLHGYGTPEATEEVSTDATDNTVQYHVTSNESEYWVLKDFNRGLKITKMVKEGQSKCLVSVLDTEQSVHPADVRAPGSLEMYKREDRDSGAVRMTSVSATPVTDRSLLGRTASKLCQGIDLYWEHAVCSATHKGSEDLHHQQRHKRLATYCGRCGCDHTVCITCGGLTQRFYIEAGKLQCEYTFNFATCPSDDYEDYYFVAECPDVAPRNVHSFDNSNEESKNFNVLG